MGGLQRDKWETDDALSESRGYRDYATIRKDLEERGVDTPVAWDDPKTASYAKLYAKQTAQSRANELDPKHALFDEGAEEEIAKAPPPVDTTRSYFTALARQNTQRQLRSSRNRATPARPRRPVL